MLSLTLILTLTLILNEAQNCRVRRVMPWIGIQDIKTSSLQAVTFWKYGGDNQVKRAPASKSSFTISSTNAVINCILGPHYPGNSGDLAGTYLRIYCILCPRRPRTYPGLMRGDIFIKKAGNLLPQDVHICRDSDQRCPGLWGGNIPGYLQEKCTPQSGQYLGLYLGHHKVQNWIPGQVPAIPR